MALVAIQSKCKQHLFNVVCGLDEITLHKSQSVTHCVACNGGGDGSYIRPKIQPFCKMNSFDRNEKKNAEKNFLKCTNERGWKRNAVCSTVDKMESHETENKNGTYHLLLLLSEIVHIYLSISCCRDCWETDSYTLPYMGTEVKRTPKKRIHL